MLSASLFVGSHVSDHVGLQPLDELADSYAALGPLGPLAH